MNVTITTARTDEDLEQLLPLIAAYQRFYGTTPDDDRNRAFFRRFLHPSDDGMLLIARNGDAPSTPVGHACLYWTFSSTTASEVVLMNDLFVVPEARGTGAGRALIEAAAQAARDRGAATLEWQTAPDNTTAQQLYDRTGAERSTWLTYELRV